MGTSGPRISRPDVLRLAEALGVRWNGIDPMPTLFAQCVEHARRLARQVSMHERDYGDDRAAIARFRLAGAGITDAADASGTAELSGARITLDKIG